MFKSALVVLAACLAASPADSADIYARVPSNFYRGTKWVLFRDDSVADPPPNVIQHENGVQVLPTYRYQQHYYPSFAAIASAPVNFPQAPFNVPVQGHIESVPVHVTPAPGHIESAPIHVTPAPGNIGSAGSVTGDYDSEVVEGKSSHFQHIPKLSGFGVTAVPNHAVHIEGPAYFDYLRKKKSA